MGRKEVVEVLSDAATTTSCSFKAFSIRPGRIHAAGHYRRGALADAEDDPAEAASAEVAPADACSFSLSVRCKIFRSREPTSLCSWASGVLKR